MAQYESDLTRFMRQYLEQHPEEIDSQKKGRAVWWDKSPDECTPPAPAKPALRAGGAEYTFKLTSDN